MSLHERLSSQHTACLAWCHLGLFHFGHAIGHHASLHCHQQMLCNKITFRRRCSARSCQLNQLKRCSGLGYSSSRGRDRTLAGGGLTRTELGQSFQSTKICYSRVVLQLNQSRAGLTVQKASALQALANIMRLGCHLRHDGGPAWPGNAAASVPSWHRQKRTALSVHPAGKAGDFCVCDSMIFTNKPRSASLQSTPDTQRMQVQ